MTKYVSKENMADIVAMLDVKNDAKYAQTSDLTTHTGDTTAHVTAAEKATWNGKASTAVATTSSNGLMSSTDKSKLDGIATGATANTAASATPLVDGTAAVGTSAKYAREDHVHPTDTSRAAASALTSHTGDTTAHVTANERAAWNGKASTAVATTSSNGLMSSTDKSKLDGIASGANNYTLPAATSSTLGGVKYDDDTIKVNSSGQLYAKEQPNGLTYAGVTVPPAVIITSETFLAISATLSSVNVPTCVAVGDNAFYSRSALKSFSLPMCTTVGVSAFALCRSITTVDLPACTTICDYAFANCRSLTTLSLPACTTIGKNAFSSANTIVTVDLPACTTVGESAFYGGRSLTTVNLPACTTVGVSAFCYCIELVNVNLPACVSVGSNAFLCASNLTSLNLPVCTTLGDYAFYGCTYSLTDVNLPACVTVGNSAFNYCGSLTTANLQACVSLGANAFNGCSNITSISIPVCETIGQSAFYRCHNLISLYLTSVSKVPTLGASAFYSNPIGGYSASAGQYGSVFVPMSLVDAFKSAPNWTSISSRIVGVNNVAIDNDTIKVNSAGKLYVALPGLDSTSF